MANKHTKRERTREVENTCRESLTTTTTATK